MNRLYLMIALGLFGAAKLFGADVSVGVSTQETYVGRPIEMQVRIDNSTSQSEPVIPEVDGLSIETLGAPSRSSQTSIFNGRVTSRSSLIYRYKVTPKREGSFTIPPIKVTADGIASITEAVRLVVTTSETGDLMFVEITGDKEKVFVGQSIDLKLKIWVRRYRDPERQVALEEPEMWRQFSDETNWGKFGESIAEMAKTSGRRPAGQPVLRKDSNGNEREYLLYEIDATVYPTHPGQVDAGGVRIVVDYPTKIGRRRDSLSSMFEDSGFPMLGPMMGDDLFRGFTSRPTTLNSRPIVAEAETQPIRVVPIPTEGRPDDYRGAVGRYTIHADASPTDAKVGDPITLEMTVNGTGPMDLVSAPDLASQPELTKNFKVSDENLAGFANGSRKVFQTTIRPRHEDASEIPPISFSYFDPVAEKFVTVQTDPIPIEVSPGDVLAIDSIVAARPAAARSQQTDSPQWNFNVGPTLTTELYDGERLLESRPNAPRLSTTLSVLLATPPCIFLAFYLFASRGRLASFTSARKRFDKASAAAVSPHDVSIALQEWLASRLGMTDQARSHDAIVGRLRRDGERDVAIRAERLFASANRTVTFVDSNSAAVETQRLRSEARQIVESMGRKPSILARPKRVAKATASSIVFLLVTSMVSMTSAVEPSLDSKQQSLMIQEAIANYQSAIQDPNKPESIAKFESAAETLRSVVDSGVQNDRLYFDLGNARYQAGQRGRAIAAFRSALKINPDDPVYYDNLIIAESETLPRTLPVRMNDGALRFVSPAAMCRLGVLAWFIFWMLMLVVFFRRRGPAKTSTLRGFAVVSLVISVIAIGSYLMRTLPLTADGTAILLGNEVVIREGDGDEFTAVATIDNADGQRIAIEDRRGGWFRIRCTDGTVGWVPQERVMAI